MYVCVWATLHVDVKLADIIAAKCLAYEKHVPKEHAKLDEIQQAFFSLSLTSEIGGNGMGSKTIFCGSQS